MRAAGALDDAQRAALRRRFLDAATADGSGGLRTTGVRWWLKYVVLVRGLQPHTRLTAASPLEEKVKAEQLLMDFVVWLALYRPSGRPLSARTIRKYVSQVRAWHLRAYRTALCGDLDYSAVNDLLRGICRLIAQPPPRERWGVRTQDLARVLDLYLSKRTVESSNWAAALTVAFCGLLRGTEFALEPGERFNPDLPPDEQPHLTRADVTFHVGEDGIEYVRLMIRPAKKGPGTPKVPLLLGGGGTLLDPVKALRRLFADDPVPESQAARTPLFRSRNAPLTVAGVRDTVKLLMKALGLDASKFGAHSLRIGGATAGLAANLSAAALRAAGRWSSDVYVLYTRASREANRHISRIVGSTPFHDTERDRVVDDELMFTSGDFDAPPPHIEIEQELIDDALADWDDEPF